LRHIRNLAEANLSRESVVTIGAFDGVHRGHQYLVGQLVEHARQTGRASVVLTFFPLPKIVLSGPQPGLYLTLPNEKATLLGELGVELVVTHPFNEQVRHTRTADFVTALSDHLKMAALWVGEDFAMGYRREGDVAFLRRQAEERGFTLRVVDLMDAGGERVSSSRVRTALADGDVAEAARLLGRPYRVTGEVVQGAGRGQTIGIPTANLSLDLRKAIPRGGVYAAHATTGSGGQAYPAVVNIGVRPTFDGSNTLTVEAHLLDFDGDLYGQTLSLDFVARLRDEKRFEGVDALVAQVRADVEQGRQILGVKRQASSGK
jgi:riboflavin kinase/FMN adenylyltransferase